ncbi:MAG: RNA polymerase sigma factor [Phycisphaerae bacterium]|nr:MAG: RNA polymerase sigma factor [Planctomycetota bacterium]KAB2944854.1 MAG: RNA polymerase sigma factor [Phycisphaerae bacterium]MBE7456859.1 RNA polymerase sigma factor [Planctomycetia bacterium]MCK6464306.1 RNA polymerase sigma factor [Phycisphaerae bacterium]MCL4717899.1 RNA polymerase sigma factor [Phycisphaerae bacterium]
MTGRSPLHAHDDSPTPNLAGVAEPLELTRSIIVRLREGEPEAGVLLERAYRDAMVRFCRGYVGRWEDAEDAVQDVFCKVLAATEVPDNFRAWLYRIARNHCLNLVRNRNRRKDQYALPAEDEVEADLTGQLTRLLEVEMGAKVRDVLLLLPESTREALRMRYVEGLSRAEIAEVLELQESIIKSRLFEGLKRIREELARTATRTG